VSVLSQLSAAADGLEFCMGVALQDRVQSDQEWYEIARASLEEMKQYRELDRSQRSKSIPENIPQNARLGAGSADKLQRRSQLSRQTEIESDAKESQNLDVQDSHGDTALMIACGSKSEAGKVGSANGCDANAVFVLLSKGCAVNVRNREELTALMFAAMHGENEIVDRLCNNAREKAELEARGGVGGDGRDVGKTALLFAAENGRLAVLRTLVRNGADVSAKATGDGSDALMLCVNRNHIECVQFLVEQQSDINHQNKLGFTSLMIAAYNGNRFVVEILLRCGAVLDLKNNRGETAYNIARKGNHLDLCSILM